VDALVGRGVRAARGARQYLLRVVSPRETSHQPPFWVESLERPERDLLSTFRRTNWRTRRKTLQIDMFVPVSKTVSGSWVRRGFKSRPLRSLSRIPLSERDSRHVVPLADPPRFGPDGRAPGGGDHRADDRATRRWTCLGFASTANTPAVALRTPTNPRLTQNVRIGYYRGRGQRSPVVCP
jgi:hypothetical protein